MSWLMPNHALAEFRCLDWYGIRLVAYITSYSMTEGYYSRPGSSSMPSRHAQPGQG